MSDKLKGLAKGGWHPKGKDGEKGSWRGDFKGADTVAGWMGKGPRKSAAEEVAGHQSAPLSSLQDPSSFGPPPKRTGTGLSAGTAASPTVQTSAASVIPDGGLGAPLSREKIEADRQHAVQREQAARQAEEEERAKPTGPYEVDTTGLSTANLPPPPKFKGRDRSQSPEKTGAARAPPPSLPPRLPPRGGGAAAVETMPPLPPRGSARANPEAGVLNQGAMNRLGAAGVSVPGFGIGGLSSPPIPSRSSTASPPVPARSGITPAPSQPTGQLSELQSRFARLSSNTTPSPSTTPASPSAGGTTWAQKQAALKTASNFHKDPSSINLSDAKNAATTANDFRNRHGEQVASGWRSANSFNSKYGVSDKFKGYTGAGVGNEGGAITAQSPGATMANATPSSGHVPRTETETGKKPPPPPPAKKAGLHGIPPPVPMSSKPNMG